MKQLYEDARNGIETRQNLSKLRQEIKDFAKMDQLFQIVMDDFDGMVSFLQDEDSKVRKNAALLMGDLDMSDFLEPLMEGYRKEDQLFVRTAYLEAIKNYDFAPYLDEFKERMEVLKNMEVTEENKKHIEEEIKALNDLILLEEGCKLHTFKGFSKPVECVLLTNKLQKQALENQVKEMLPNAQFLPFGGGVRVKTNDFDQLFKIRTFHTVLFAIPGMTACSLDANEMAEKLAQSGLLNLLRDSHNESGPYSFRTECKCHLDLERKTQFTKKLANELQLLTHHELMNSTTDYEFELRIVENKEGKCNVLLKMNTILDERFSYWKAQVAQSIRPANAAVLVELARPYMAKDAQVLDPFCGAATMLIERQKVVKGNTSFGLDINEEAIQCAKKNCKNAGQIIHFVHKDFFRFNNEVLFDEIFTNMPFAQGHVTNAEVRSLIIHFFKHAKEVMKKDGTIILHTHDYNLVKKYALENGYTLVKAFQVSQKEGTVLCIFKLEDK